MAEWRIDGVKESRHGKPAPAAGRLRRAAWFGLRRVHASKDYRFVYAVVEKRLLVLVVRVAHRKGVYRGL